MKNNIYVTDTHSIVPLDIEILKAADTIKYDLEMHDKLIIATAQYFNAPIITKDKTIKESGLCRIIW